MKVHARVICYMLLVTIIVSMVQQNPGSTFAEPPSTPAGPCLMDPNTGFAFSDVDAHYYACYWLTRLYRSHVVTGYDLTYCTQHSPTGYPCFMPFNRITRGQFAKVLTLWFGISYGGSAQHFQDVPPGSPFYQYVEAAYDHVTPSGERTISGYDGDPSHVNPCLNPPAPEISGLHYFRPCENLTRGQMAKMVSNLANFSESMAQRVSTFSDVPTSHTFFKYIERLVMHLANGPYPPMLSGPPACGSPPCFFPNTLAYRIDAAYHIAVGGRSNSFAQVFPHAGSLDPSDIGYDGIYAYVETPARTAPTAVPGNPGPFIAAPVGLSEYYNNHFVESGPQRACLPNCVVHPYASWHDGDVDSMAVGAWDPSVNLVPWQGYVYRTDPVAGTSRQWNPQWCDSNACHDLLQGSTTGDLGRNSLPFVISGGESMGNPGSLQSVAFGSIGSQSFAASRNRSWANLCYDPGESPIIILHGSISSCDASLRLFYVNYEGE